MSTPALDDLTEDNVEGVVIHTMGTYEWVYRLYDTGIDGRCVRPYTENGDLQEMVVEMGDSYGWSVDTFATRMRDRGGEVIGYADSREEVQSLTRDDYKSR